MAKAIKSFIIFVLLLVFLPFVLLGMAFFTLFMYEKHKDKLKPIVKRKLRLLKRAKEKLNESVNELSTSEVGVQVRERVEDVKEELEERVQNVKLTKRQQEIVKHLEQAGELGMKELSDLFSQVTPRTLRRDLTQLETLGIVKQFGRTKNSFYRLLKSAQKA